MVLSEVLWVLEVLSDNRRQALLLTCLPEQQEEEEEEEEEEERERERERKQPVRQFEKKSSVF